MTEVSILSQPKPRGTAMLSMNVSETGRHDWIEAPDTKVRTAALRVMLIAICFIAAGFMVLSSLFSPAEVEHVARLAGL
jgi:hypothetical protein